MLVMEEIVLRQAQHQQLTIINQQLNFEPQRFHR